MRIAFLATSDFALPALDVLVASAEVALVVTAPSRAQGRGRVAVDPPVAARAKELGLRLLQPEKINAPDAIAAIAEARPDLLVVVAYGQILGSRLLAMAPRGSVNVHGSLLPRWRGAAPIARAIAAGDTTTGVSLQFMVRELDAGDVIDRESVAIGPDETAGELTERLSRIGAELLSRNLPRLAQGVAPREPQDPRDVTLAPPLSKEEGRVDWSLAAPRIGDHVRAMTPWPGAFGDYVAPRTSHDPPLRVVFRKAEPAARAPADSAESSLAPADRRAGAVLRADRELEIAGGEGALRILRLQRAGKRAMDATEFLRGTRIEVGGIFQ